jgi:3-hydroxyacyl-[acyl-carrier-protein] dehydratase
MKDNSPYIELYSIGNVIKHDNLVKATVRLNPSHDVFRGHFPGNPILPGVFIIQILKDIATNLTQKKLMVTKADSIKYLAFINPVSDSTLVFETTFSDESDKIIKFNCSVTSENTVFCRIKGEMNILE